MSPLDDSLRIGVESSGLATQAARQGGSLKPDDLSFKDVLEGLVDKVDVLQKDADASIQGLVIGETTNIHDVAI